MIKGKCHCGEVTWKYDAAPKAVTSCNCTVCRRYGALWAYGHLDQGIAVSGASAAYVRSDGGDVEFRFCETCGCLTHYLATSKDENGLILIAVNLRMASPKDTAELPMRRFDGHDTWSELPNEDRRMSDIW